MSYSNIIFSTTLVDETHFFKKVGDAAKCKAQLEEKQYRGNRMYKEKKLRWRGGINEYKQEKPTQCPQQNSLAKRACRGLPYTEGLSQIQSPINREIGYWNQLNS